MAIKKKDFVEIDYTGKLKDEDVVFDTTEEKVAKEHDVYSTNVAYEPAVICVGEGQLLKGLDDELEGKDVGEYKVELSPEKAFGKKDPKMIKLVPMSKFKENNIKPVPGLQLNIDGMIGTIKTVTGGRVMVDFNHPLSGKDVIYDIKVKRIVIEKAEKIMSLLKLILNLKEKEVEISAEGNKAKVKIKKKELKDLPKEVAEKLSEKIKELVGIDTEFIQ